jgi:hypothetical protein
LKIGETEVREIKLPVFLDLETSMRLEDHIISSDFDRSKFLNMLVCTVEFFSGIPSGILMEMSIEDMFPGSPLRDHLTGMLSVVFCGEQKNGG